MSTYSLQQDAAEVVANADFREFWPFNVRRTLARAALTEGEIPPYAVRDVTKALRAARNLERRMAKDIEVGEAALTQADRKRLAVR